MTDLNPIRIKVEADVSELQRVDRGLKAAQQQAEASARGVRAALSGMFSGNWEDDGRRVGAGAASGMQSGVNAGAGGVRQAIAAMFSGSSRDAGTEGRQAGAAMARGVGDGFRASSGALRGAIGNAMQGVMQGVGQEITRAVSASLRAGIGALTSQDAYRSFDGAKAGLKSLGADVADLEKRAASATKALGGIASKRELLSSSYDIVSSGFQGQDAIDIAVASKKASIAAPDGTGELASSATIGDAATSVMNSYGIAAKDVNTVIGQMIGTVNAGKITLNEYASLIGQVSSVAAGSKVSLSELNATIATATVAGVPASSAIAGIKAGLSAIAKPSQDAAEYAKSLGIEFSSSALASKGLVGVLQDIKAKGAATSEGIYKLFGSTEAWTALAPVFGKLGDEFDKLQETVTGVDLDKAFEEGSKSVAVMQARMAALKEEADLKLQTAIAPVFEAGNLALGALLESLAEGGPAFETLNQAAMQFRDYLQGNPEVIAAMATGLSQLASIGLEQLAIGLQQATAALQQNPQLIAEMVGGITQAVVAVGQFAVGMGQAVASIGQFLAPIAQAVQSLLGGVGASNSLAQSLGQATVYVGVLAGGVSVFSTIAGAVSSIAGFVSSIGPIVSAIGAVISGPIVAAVAAAALTIYNIVTYAQNWKDVCLGINQTLVDAGNFIKDVARGILDALGLSQAVDAAWGGITGVVGKANTRLGEVIGSTASAVKNSDLFRGIWAGMTGVIGDVATALDQVLGGVLSGLIAKAQEMLSIFQQAAGLQGGGEGLVAAGEMALGGDTSGASASAQAAFNDKAFMDKLKQVAGRIGAKPEDLLTAMLYESAGTLSPSMRGPHVPGDGKAVGLIQFMPSTARGLGTTDSALSQMSRVQQLDYVEKYFKPFAGQLGDYKSLYATIHGGNPRANLNASDGYRTTGEAIRDGQAMYASMARGALSGSSGGGFASAGSIAGGTSGPAGKVVVQRSGQYDEHGLEKLVVKTFDKAGNAISALVANSGIRSTQGNFGQQARDVSGTNNPLPYGRYAIGETVAAPNIPGYGRQTTILSPKFETARAGIEAHVDGNRANSPGSAGCLVFKNEQEWALFQKALRESGANELIFKEGKASDVPKSAPGAKGVPPKTIQPGEFDRAALAAATPSKADETAAMQAALAAARKSSDEKRQKADAQTRSTREAEDLKRNQAASEAKLKLQGAVASVSSPEAKAAGELRLRQLDLEQQGQAALIDLERKRADLVTARDRKKADLASADKDVAGAAKLLPDFSAAIAGYDAAIKKQKDLQAAAIGNLTAEKRSADQQKEITAQIEARNKAAEVQLQLQLAELDASQELAALTNPMLASAIGFEKERLQLQAERNRLLQDELDKQAELARAIDQMNSVGGDVKPLQAQLEASRQRSQAITQRFDTREKSLKLRGDNAAAQGELDRRSALAAKDEFLAGPGQQLKKGTIDRMRQVGNVWDADKLEKELSLQQQALAYRKQQIDLERQIAEFRAKGVELTDAEVKSMRDGLAAVNEFQLEGIANQFDTFKNQILEPIKNSLGTLFKDLISGSKSAEEAFSDFIGSVTSQILDMAVQGLLSNLFGGAFGGGGGGGLFSGIFAADGYVPHHIPNFAGGGLADAARRERMASGGKRPMLAVVNDAEMILTAAQTKAFMDSGMANSILNFAGGKVPALSSAAAGGGGGDVNVPLSITVQGGGGLDEQEWARIGKLAARAAEGTVRREMRPRGRLT